MRKLKERTDQIKSVGDGVIVTDTEGRVELLVSLWVGVSFWAFRQIGRAADAHKRL